MEMLKYGRHWDVTVETPSATSGRRTWERVANVVSKLGPPPDHQLRKIPLRKGSSADTGKGFQVKEEESVGVNGDVWKRIFYGSPIGEVRFSCSEKG
jgi:hypothetical protein